MKIIVTMILTNLVTNLFFFYFFVFLENPKTKMKFSANWWSGNEKCLFFVPS